MASLVLSLSLLAVHLFSTAVSAENATIFNMTNVPNWQTRSLMALSITAQDGDAAPITFELYPLTRNQGLNGTDRERMSVSIQGSFVLSADRDQPVAEMDLRPVIYLNCDPTNSSDEINEIMAEERDQRPAAILLYSLAGNCCGLGGENLPYTSIFTMANSVEARAALNYTHAGAVAQISGHANTTTSDDQNGQGGSNSAVAMSILYSITGLITLLFLVIIATGAIRAHRYPERYGPRSGYGGRPRQSRAKGLARAVLETLPIVKFGGPNPPKPDPALELEHQPSRSSHDPATGTRLSAIPEEPQSARFRQNQVIPPTIAESPAEVVASPAVAVLAANNNTSTPSINAVTHGPNDEHLGCPICTEDFKVGEDVRVLPCDHKFHPACIDPWLINISGTCPLCRLDLRPQGSNGKDGSPPPSSSSDNTNRYSQPLPPPLAAGDWNEQGTGTSTTQRRRSSRLLDLHRLRHASVEERIEILRLHRTQSQQQPQNEAQTAGGSEVAEGEERQRARLADRLRDKFKIRTTRQGHAGG